MIGNLNDDLSHLMAKIYRLHLYSSHFLLTFRKGQYATCFFHSLLGTNRKDKTRQSVLTYLFFPVS